MKIEDFTNEGERNPVDTSNIHPSNDPNCRYFAYIRDIFYIATSHEIKLFFLHDESETGETISIQAKAELIATISSEELDGTPRRIHGLFTNKPDLDWKVNAKD